MSRSESLRARLDAGFAAWARLAARRSGWVLLGSLFFTAVLAAGLPRFAVDNSTESFLRPGDPARQRYDEMRRLFGQDDRILIAVETETVFDAAFLDRLRMLHRTLEQDVPHLSSVESLWTARDVRTRDGVLVVERLLDRERLDAQGLAAVRARLHSTPALADAWLDAEERLTAILLEPDIHSSCGQEGGALAGFEPEGEGGAPPLSSEESFAQVDVVRARLALFDTPGFRVHLAGGPVLNHHATQLMTRDLGVLLFACLGILVAVLAFVFRRASAVILPLAVVASANLALHGAMGWLGVPGSITAQVVPLLLVAVGVCNAVHFLTWTDQLIDAGASTEDALSGALGEAGVAVLLANVTTAAGLASVATADLAQVAEIGRTAPFGVMLAFAYAVALIPAGVAIVGRRRSAPAGGLALRRALSERLVGLGSLSARRPGVVLVSTASLVLLAGLGVAELRFANDGLSWFPAGDPVREAIGLIDDRLGGSTRVEIVIDAGERDAFHSPALMTRLDHAAQVAQGFESRGLAVGRVFSAVDIVKETHRALSPETVDAYALPMERSLLAQELILFEGTGSGDLATLLDAEHRRARLAVRMPYADGLRLLPAIAELETKLQALFDEGIEVHATGLGALMARTFDVVNPTMARSYAIALGVITPLMVLLLGSFRRGVLAMLPNLLPVWLTLGLMGWADIPMDNSSLMVGCLVIGLAVDDTIHFMHRFRCEVDRGRSTSAAIRSTLATTGAALCITSVVLVCSFAVLMLAEMQNAVQFGLLAAFGIATAFLADLLVAPAVIVLGDSLTISPRHARR